MKTSFIHVWTWLLLAGLSIAASASAEEPEQVPPTSSEWEEIYDPPSKAPAEVPVGSKLRAELFELLRTRTSPQARFSGSLKAFRNWAFFSGRTVDPAGNSLKHPPLGNDDAAGLWLRTQEGWIVVAHSFGHSDAFFVVWPEQYGVPRALLGME